MLYNPEMAEYAKGKGWTVEDHGHASHESYTKGNVHIWQIRVGWRWAQVVNFRYTNHETFKNLKDALDKEIRL